MNKFGLQAYTMRDYYSAEGVTKESLTEAFKKVKAFGYDEIQTAGSGALTDTEYAEAAKEAGLKIVGTHIGFDKLIEDPDEAMRVHKEVFDTDIIGTGMMPAWARETKNDFMRFISEVNRFADYIGKFGFKFSYHNHSFEFVKFDDGKNMMDYMADEFDREKVSFCLDTYWVQNAGGNSAEWIEKLKGRIDILHLKDMGVKSYNGDFRGYITEIGNGNINFKPIIKKAEECGVKYFCVEQDFCPNDALDSLKLSADYIKKELIK